MQAPVGPRYRQPVAGPGPANLLALFSEIYILSACREMENDDRVCQLTAEVKRLEHRVEKMEIEIMALAKMESAIKSIFGSGKSGDSD